MFSPGTFLLFALDPGMIQMEGWSRKSVKMLNKKAN